MKALTLFRFQNLPLLCASGFFLFGIVFVSHAQDAQPDTQNVIPKTESRPSFRGSQVDVNAMHDEITRQGDVVEESKKEQGDLGEQKQTVTSELRYARSKLEAAQRRLNIASSSGESEQADKFDQDVKDWDARVKTLEAQLTQIDSEMLGMSAQARIGGAAATESNIISPGENVEVFVVEDPSFNGRYQVRRGGYIILPAVGRVFVAGKTLNAAEAAVKKALETSQLRHASVMIEKVEGGDLEAGPVIYLAGEFRYPRPFRIPANTKASVVSVILSSGGVSDKADLTRVKVMRVVANKNVVEEVNVQKILEGAGLTSDLTLNEGDVVMIPAGSSNVVFVTGNVKRQGNLPLKPGDKLSAYAAILQSGGFARFADLKKVYVLRATPDGTKIKIPVNVTAIQRGQQSDIALEGNDIVVVPEKFFSF